MSDPKGWSVEGVDPDIRDAARRAAEDEGVGVGDWVEAAIRRQAAAGTGGDAEETHPVIGMLEAMEARLAEQDSRLTGALQPLAESLDALDGRLRALEASVEPWPGEPPQQPDPDMPDADEAPGADLAFPADDAPDDDADAAPDWHEDGFAGADAGEAAAPAPDARRVRIGAGERLEPLFGKGAPGEDDLREADAAVEADLNTLFDDGSHAGDDGRPAARRAIYDEAGGPRAARSTRGTVVLLGIVAVLILIAAGIVVFVWNEVSRPPVPPVPPVPEDVSSLAAEPPPSAEPPAAPLPSVPGGAEGALAPAAGSAELAPSPIGDIDAPAGADAGAGGDEPDTLGGIRAAAEAGDPRAQNELAVRYLVGREVPQDYVRAAEWLERAAAAGVTSAQYNLGVLYDSGRGVAADPVEALIWFHAAAEKGHGRAQYALASAYAAGRGIERNPDGAMRWLERAAGANVIEAQMSLASILSTGQTTREELVEALYWYRIADAGGAAGASDEADRIASVLAPDERAAVNRRVSDFLSQRLARPAVPGTDGTAPRSPPPPAPTAEAPTAAAPTPESPPAPVPPAAETPPADAPADAPAGDASAGGTVRQVQSLLSALGFRPGPADGEMGARTRAAIVEYQREFGMAETGEATPELLRHLREVSGIAE